MVFNALVAFFRYAFVRFWFGSVMRMPRFCLRHQINALSFNIVSPQHCCEGVGVSEDYVFFDYFLY